MSAGRIQHVIAQAGWGGGAERHYADVMLGLRDRGWEQIVHLPGEGGLTDRLRAEGIAVRTHSLHRKSLSAHLRLLAAQRRFKPHVVMTLFARACQIAARLPAPVAHQAALLDGAKYLRRAAAVIAPSAAAAGALARLGTHPDRIRVIANHRVARGQDHAASSRRGRRLIGVGRLDPIKGFHHLIAALSFLPDDATLTLVGDGPERARLEAVAAPFGARVRFLGWREDAPALMAEADLLVMASGFETFGLVVLEAWAAGAIAVVTPGSGPEEIVRACDPALVADAATPEALAATIRFALDAPETRKAAWRSAARAALEDKFGREGRLDAYEALLRSLTAGDHIKSI